MNFQPLIQEFGIDKLPEDQQKVILGQVFNVLLKRITLRMAQDLTDEQVKQLEAVAVNGDDAAVEELERVYPAFKQVYQEEIDSLKEDMQALIG